MLVVLFVSPRWRKKERKTESLCGTATRRKPRTHTEMKAQMCKWYRRRAGPPISPKVLVGLYQVLRVEGMNQDGQVETKRKGVLITMAAIINWALMRTAFLFHSLSLYASRKFTHTCNAHQNVLFRDACYFPLRRLSEGYISFGTIT